MHHKTFYRLLLSVLFGASLLPATSAAVDLGVVGKKLSVSDKTATSGKAKVSYLVADKTAGITKGAGMDPNAISAVLHIAYEDRSAVGIFTIPAGADDGTDGWSKNDAKQAKYKNKAAPAGPTQTKASQVKPGKGIKLSGSGLGDVAIDVLGAGAPAGSIYTAYCVTNDGEEVCHCSAFSSCSYKLVSQDTGAKLTCKSGSPDPECLAIEEEPIEEERFIFGAGHVNGALTFGAGQANETTLTTAGGVDQGTSADDHSSFVALYDDEGALQWATRVTPGYDGSVPVSQFSNAIVGTVDDTGLYITFEGTWPAGLTAENVGGGSLGCPGNAHGPTSGDVCIGKIGYDGVWAWLRHIGPASVTTENVTIRARQLSAAGSNLVVTGYQQGGTATLEYMDGSGGTGPGAGSSGDTFSFVADKTTGDVAPGPAGGVRISSVTGNAHLVALQYGLRIANSSGDWFSFDSTAFTDTNIVFDSGHPSELTVVDADNDGFLAKRAPATGDAIWAHTVGTTQNAADQVVDLDATEAGGAVVMGYFNAPGLITGTGGDLMLTSSDTAPDSFVARYDSAGNLLWAKTVETSASQAIQLLHVYYDEARDEVWVRAWSRSSGYTFGPGEAGETSYTPSDPSNFFFAAFDGATGEYLRLHETVTSSVAAGEVIGHSAGAFEVNADGKLESSLAIAANSTVTFDNLGSPVVQNFGSGVSYGLLRVDPATAGFVEYFEVENLTPAANGDTNVFRMLVNAP